MWLGLRGLSFSDHRHKDTDNTLYFFDVVFRPVDIDDGLHQTQKLPDVPCRNYAIHRLDNVVPLLIKELKVFQRC
jgi:hypothetical protein